MVNFKIYMNQDIACFVSFAFCFHFRLLMHLLKGFVINSEACITFIMKIRLRNIDSFNKKDISSTFSCSLSGNVCD